MFMSMYSNEYMHVIRNFSDVFDVFYCKDEKFAKQYFNTKVMPSEIPHVYIIDPKSKDGEHIKKY